MTETKVSDLIGLSEMAEVLGVTKNEANAIRQRPGFPSPKIKFKMGPAWDQTEVLAYVGRGDIVEIADETGTLVVSRKPAKCPSCKDGSLVVPMAGSLYVKWTQERGSHLVYSWTHEKCHGWGEVAFSPSTNEEEK